MGSVVTIQTTRVPDTNLSEFEPQTTLQSCFKVSPDLSLYFCSTTERSDTHVEMRSMRSSGRN